MTRIFIISKNLMFGRGLESLLADKEAFEVIGQQKDAVQAIEHIQMLEPDVVLLDSSNSKNETEAEIVQILKAIPSVKVIGLSLQNNKFYIYRAKKWVAESVDDLLRAIRVDSSPAEVFADEADDDSSDELPVFRME